MREGGDNQRPPFIDPPLPLRSALKSRDREAINYLRFSPPNILTRFPNHDNVIVSRASDTPLPISVPTQIARFARVPTVDEEQLGWSIVRIIRRLLLTDPGDIPNVDAPVRGRRRKDGRRVRRPGETNNLVRVRGEGMKRRRKLAKIPEGNGLSECEEKRMVR